MKSKILKFLMVTLGFGAYTSCDGPDMYGCPMPAPEYGCPYAEYLFNAEVKDGETDTPIKGIRVSVIEKHSEQFTDTLAVGLTQADGKVRLQVGRMPTDKHTLVADDVDGEANGGKYNSTSTVITTDDDDYTGGSGAWDQGTAEHNVTISLSKE